MYATFLPGNGFNLPLPLGISFFTFQAISYLIDVYRKEVEAERSLVSVACYISMIPQLLAGPIVRFSSINEEIKSGFWNRP